MDKQGIRERLAALMREREDYIEQANRSISYMNGRIDAYKEMLETSDDEPVADDNS